MQPPWTGSRATTAAPPTISSWPGSPLFYGIVIRMYRPYPMPPHFRARYGEHGARIELGTLRSSRSFRSIRCRSVTTVLRVTDAKPMADHRLRVTFKAGLALEFDCAFLLRGPLGEPVRDVDYFLQVRHARSCGRTGSARHRSCFTATTTSPLRRSSRWLLMARAESSCRHSRRVRQRRAALAGTPGARRGEDWGRWAPLFLVSTPHPHRGSAVTTRLSR